jgi:putative oxidoreductase
LNTKLALYLHAVLRIVAALLFLQHGTQKLFGIPPGGPFTGLFNFSLLGIAGMLEVVGGVLILIGLFTRPAAFILSGEMAVAYFRVHAGRDFFPLVNGGEITVFFCFYFLYLSMAGAGPWSVDQILARKRGRAH